MLSREIDLARATGVEPSLHRVFPLKRRRAISFRVPEKSVQAHVLSEKRQQVTSTIAKAADDAPNHPMVCPHHWQWRGWYVQVIVSSMIFCRVDFWPIC